MKKYMYFTLRTMLIVACLSFNISHCTKALSNLNFLENQPNNNTLPNHFRKSTDKISNVTENNINLKGLDKLNISGSGQFSESALLLIKNSIPNDFNIIDIDLRQESHGFVNGIAVSWENEKNNANMGLSSSEVLSTETKLLESIKIGSPVTFYNKKETIVPNSIQSELELTKSKGIEYIRIPVTDGHTPSDDMVNYFINFVENQPSNTWLHFHCKEGIGRTTTFMIMYDIMKNYKEVSLNDIIKRQVILSGMKEKNAQSFYTGHHFEFLNNFYNNYISKSTSFISYNNFANNLSNFHIKNPITSKHLYNISYASINKEEQTTMSTLLYLYLKINLLNLLSKFKLI